MEKHSSVAANGPCPGSLPQRRIFTYKLANKQQTWKPNGKSSGVQAGSPSHLLAESLHLLPRRCHAGVARNLRKPNDTLRTEPISSAEIYHAPLPLAPGLSQAHRCGSSVPAESEKPLSFRAIRVLEVRTFVEVTFMCPLLAGNLASLRVGARRTSGGV